MTVHRRVFSILCVLIIVVSLAACQQATDVKAGSVPTPGTTPAATPAASPTATPVPTPTPTPVPTPTPDPWAEYFSADGPRVCVPDPVKGPWVYKSPTLSVTIELARGGSRNRRYYIAEIYSREERFFGGFAYQNDSGTSTELPYKIARRYGAVFGITADYVSHTSNRKGVMIRNGEVYYDEADNSTLAIMPDGSLQYFDRGETTAEELLAAGVTNSFSFGPIIIQDGQITDYVNTDHLRSSNYRTAIGMVEPGHYICITTLGGFTLTELAQLFADKGCTLAYNLDGGHSACMIFMGEQINHSLTGVDDDIRQRSLPDLIMLGYSASVPSVDDPVFYSGVNVYNKNKPDPTDGPVE